ncbi:transglutaminase-like domain-containing protein [Thermotoga profunda]|uniref:transglutaminase-like domain-containing protein n=1 Tax=Thermotoga profunda TaxID=1508420 RepID=UPI0005970585|nr:transglutaminase-like domain-containing protein [Thermotoga profunda]
MEFLMCDLPEDVQREEKIGNFTLAFRLIDKWLKDERITQIQRQRLLYERERINMLLENYPFDEEEALKKAKEKITDFTYDEFYELLENGYIDYILVDGKRKFQERFIPNIGFALPKYKERMQKDKDSERAKELLHKRLDELLSGNLPREYKVRIKMNAKIKGDGKSFRVWLPFPKEELQVRDVKLISASHENYFIAPNDTPQRTIYFESKDKEYFIEFEYTVSEWINKVDPSKVERPDIDEHLNEDPPHIVFSPYLKRLTNEILQGESNDYLKAMKIYDWITNHVRYSYVRPYATFENISKYVSENLKGDCGFQAILFITMCRIAGIPARWQSGWYANPVFASSHDWALFYVKPYGWLPVDPSFGGARRDNEPYRRFYFGNLDGFRMVANSDFMKDFEPKTVFYREDPTDNQTGEAESEGKKVKLQTKIEVISFQQL